MRTERVVSYGAISANSCGAGTQRGGRMSEAPGLFVPMNAKPAEKHRGERLLQSAWAPLILSIVKLPWNMWWQVLVICTIIFSYICHLLLAFCLDSSSMTSLFILTLLAEMFFMLDVAVHLLHISWPLLRYRIRVYRRSLLLLAYDVISLFPFIIVFKYIINNETLVLVGRVLIICRIYRIFIFYYMVNEKMHSSRKVVYVLEHFVALVLYLHAGTCLTFAASYLTMRQRQFQDLFPIHIVEEKMHFSSYSFCFYYSACRLCNVIFGDGFPASFYEKWITSWLMLIGFVFIRYQFAGILGWELVISNQRRAIFVDRYHHMLNYLRFHGAPSWLTKQAENFKLQLWEMKDGILNTEDLCRIPLPLQMEFIFDINVQHLHYTLIFRDNDESLLRCISLLMKHEIFLEGQTIWSQGVVKTGLICVKQGVIEMLSDEDDESPMIAFKKGTVLGELSLFYSIPSKVTVRAATYVELQVLQRTDFMRLMVEHHDMLDDSKNIIMQRLRNTRQRQEEIEDYDRGDARLIRAQYRPMKVLKNHLKGIEDEDPTLVDDFHMYYRDRNNILRPKFTDEYLELYEITSNVTTIQNPKICLRARFPWILEPDTDLRLIFDVLHFMLVIYVCLMTPYKLFRNMKIHKLMKVVDTVVYTGLLFNLYLQCTTAIINKKMKKVTVKDILDEKMSTVGFYLDLVSVFPMNIFAFGLGSSVLGTLLNVAPTLQIWHLWDYMQKWERSFHSNERLVCITKFLLVLMILSYWSGCILYLHACPQMLCNENSWMSQLIYWETKVLITNVAKHESRYYTALAFGVAVFTGSGRSDISPGNNDLVVTSALFLIGTYLICFYNAKISSLYLLSNQRKAKFKEEMRQLFYFLSVNHVSKKIKARVRKFFGVQWYYNNAVSTEEIFKDMSTKIQQEVLALEMLETLLCCPLFSNCSRDFLQTVAANTRSIVLPDNEIVQHAGDIGRDIYILQKGHCNMVNQQGSVAYNVGPGHSIGVVEMLFGLPKVYTVLTSTNCILLYLEYSALVQSWSPFPDISDPIIKVLEDVELKETAQKFEDPKQQIGRLSIKTNRITQELKESFVFLLGRKEKRQFVDEFENLGVLKYVRWFFLPGCITPHGVFLKIWCSLRFILAFYYIISVPYNIATKQHKNGAGYDWPDILLYLDLVVMGYVAYYNEKSLLVTHPLLTVAKYLKTTFLLDLISVAPFEQFFLIINKNTDVDICRVNRVLLVTRIFGTFSYWENDIMRVNQAVVLLKFLPLGLTVVNFATALVYVSACVTYVSNSSYYLYVNCTKAILTNSHDSDAKYALNEYVKVFFCLFEIFLGCGCTSMIISGTVEVLVMMLLQLMSVLYFAFMCGHIASTRSATAHALLNYTEKRRDLANFLYQNNVEPMLTAQTLRYFEYVWKRTHGSNPQQICRCLNSALMEDTLVFMYEQALREVPLFGKVDRSFIRVITQHLNEMYVLKGETVIQCKDVQPYIFIIYRGKVDVFNSFNEMITCMGPGGMFGNFSGNPIACSEVTIYASRSLDLLVIPSHTFFNLIKYYPKIKEPLKVAFAVSKDYILPISMNTNGDDSSSESHDFDDVRSLESTVESKSASSRLDVTFYQATGLSISSSHSSLTQSHHSHNSISFSNSFLHFSNLLFPGSALLLVYGYLMCFVATSNYVLILYEMVTSNDCPLIFWLQFLFDISFYIKIALEMHEGFLSRHGEVVLDPSRCRRRYFNNRLVVWSNVLANIPFEVFGLLCSAPLTFMHYFRVNKILRLKHLVEFYNKTSAELTNNITILQLAMTVSLVIILIHTLSCIWLLLLTATSPVITLKILKIRQFDMEDPNSNWDYTTSLYVILAKLTATGSDELVYSGPFAIMLASIALVCGKMLAATVVATSIQVANSTKHALTTYEMKIGEVFATLKNQGLSGYQQEKFWQYVKQLWVSERGRQLPELLHQTPYVRKCDLMSAMFGHHLRNSFIFGGTGEAFLRQLIVVLKYTNYFPGNYIVMAGDSETQMHFVESGTVAVVSVRSDLTETTHELLQRGDSFGILQGLNRGIQHCFTYKAHTKASILTLSLDSWINILQFFPEAQKLISERTELIFTEI